MQRPSGSVWLVAEKRPILTVAELRLGGNSPNEAYVTPTSLRLQFIQVMSTVARGYQGSIIVLEPEKSPAREQAEAQVFV